MIYKELVINHTTADVDYYSWLFQFEERPTNHWYEAMRMSAHSLIVYTMYDVMRHESDAHHIWDRHMGCIRRNKTSLLFVDLSDEPAGAGNPQIVKFLNNLQNHCPGERIVFGTQCMRFSQHLQQQFPAAQVWLYNSHEQRLRRRILRADTVPELDHQPDYDYTCLNRRYAAHRIYLLYQLRDNLHRINYTLHQTNPWTGADETARILLQLDQPEIGAWQERHWRQLEDVGTDPSWAATLAGKYSLVTESTTRDDYTFVTEKTYTPIAFGRPFCVLGNNHVEHTLERQGYQVFERPSGSTWQERADWIAENYRDFVWQDNQVEYNRQHFLDRTSRQTYPERLQQWIDK